MIQNKPFQGFSKLKLSQRIEKLKQLHFLNESDTSCFAGQSNHFIQLADQLIENAIGYYQLPLGVAVNFFIDSKDYIIPMAIEETSVIAAASKTAKWIREKGTIQTQALGYLSIGQIQFSKLNNPDLFRATIRKNKASVIKQLNRHISKSLLERGGGVHDIKVRCLKRNDGNFMGIVHVFVDTCDAMGANIINKICEYLRDPLEDLTHEKAAMCILSNLCDSKLIKARVEIHDIAVSTAKAIAEASLFAEMDPYRAATHNKGALNGMDAVVIATGNDWRAVEAGIHAYAAVKGKYSPITKWNYSGEKLIGELIAPINVGIIGGVTHLHPIAALCLKMMKITKAEQLARIIAAVGLVQNLGALKALTGEGICEGHMRLHLSNLCIAAGMQPHEILALQPLIIELFKTNKSLSQKEITELLEKNRSQQKFYQLNIK